MKKTLKSLVSNNNKDRSFIVLTNGQWQSSQMFCPICDFVMSSYSDYEIHEEYYSCKECFLKFIEPRKNKWLDGWRPTTSEINIHKDKLRCNTPYFILS